MTQFKKKILINSGLVGIILIVAMTCLYVVINKIDIINSEILGIKAQDNARLLQIEEYTSLSKDGEKSEEYIAAINKALPARDDLFVFRSQMEQLARKRNLRSGFSFGSETHGDEKTLGNASFNISVEGSLSSAISFIKDMENSGYLINLSRTSIIGSSDNASGRIDGLIFFKNE